MKLGQRYQVELKSLSKELLVTKNKNRKGNIFAISTTKWMQLLVWVLQVCEKSERKWGNYSCYRRPQGSDQYALFWKSERLKFLLFFRLLLRS